ncbi:MAG TPA: PAS domain S-box protein [Chthoniobacterales bacterium]
MEPSSHDQAEAFQLLVESVKDYAIFMLDPEGRVATWNIGAQRFKQYSAPEIIGRHFSCFYPPEESAKLSPDEELQIALRDGRFEAEGWRLRKDGTRFWANVVITPVPNREGVLIGFAKVTRDLSERRRAEENLRTSEEQLRLLVEGVEDYAIFMLNPAGYVQTWNAGAEKIKGYTATEAIGLHLSTFYPREHQQSGKANRLLAQAAQSGHVVDRGTRVRKDGTTFQAEAILTALRDKSGELRGFSKVTRDITEQVAKQHALEFALAEAKHAGEVKDHFLSVLSHELRTPLTPILAAVSYMVENADESSEQFAQDLQMIRRNVLLEARLIDDLLDLTRITNNKLDLHFESVDPQRILQEVAKMSAHDIEEKRIELSLHFDAAQHHVWADPVRIRQVFWNVLSNAVKFTPNAGRITVTTKPASDERLLVEISDTGVGFEPADAGRIFSPFEQGERTVTRRFGGLGLGLAISHSVMAMHKGTITARSSGPGQGATFTISLKAIPAIEGGDQPPAPKPIRRDHGSRILLVEDHEDTLALLSKLLSRCGYKVTTASTVNAAIRQLEQSRFDIVVSDIGLPDGSGCDVMAKGLRDSASADLKGIAISGFGSQEDVKRSKASGFLHHLTKPIDFQQLQRALDEIEASRAA